jgi:hypothetical protein
MTNRERQKRYYRWLLEATRQGVLNNEKIDLRVIKQRYWVIAVTTPDGVLAYFTLDEFYAMLDIGIAYAQAIKEQRLKEGGARSGSK